MVKTRAGHCCEVNNCQDHTYLEIHHIDENRENNVLENLILLCRKHHAMAHAGQIDRKSLRIYINKAAPKAMNINPLDTRAYTLITQKFNEKSIINQIKNISFINRISTEFVDCIHDLPYIWQDPFSNFNDIELNKLNHQLRDACENFSRVHAHKTFPPVGGSGYYEVPKSYDQDTYYSEVKALKDAANNVGNLYDQLLRAAVVAGIDC